MRGHGRVFNRGARWWFAFYVRGKEFREPGGATEGEAKRKLKARLKEIAAERFVEPQHERMTVSKMLDLLVEYLKVKGRRSLPKLESHAKSLRRFFGLHRAVDVTEKLIDAYKADRRHSGRADATVNRELEVLRQAYLLAVNRKLLSSMRVPTIEMYALDNARQGFFDRSEVEALLRHVPDADLADYIEWAFRTGMRKGEAAKLTWEMLDRPSWVLRIPGSITKNKRGRALKLEGAVRTIIERRLKARRLDCVLIFHRIIKAKAGRPIGDFWAMWRKALEGANLPPGRLFHDLRRSAVRNLIRSGVDPSIALKVSGHKTRSMLDRYNIIEEQETGTAFRRVEEWLSVQPTERNILGISACAGGEGGQNTDSPSLLRNDEPLASGTYGSGIGSSGRIRTYDPPVNSRMLYR
jgi:integrase